MLGRFATCLLELHIVFKISDMVMCSSLVGKTMFGEFAEGLCVFLCRSIFNNQLTGTVPTELGSLTRIHSMYVKGETWNHTHHTPCQSQSMIE